MLRSERVVVYSLLAVCGLGALGWLRALPAHAASPALTTAPAAATVATCDIYAIVERVLDTETYAAARKTAEEAIKTAMTPMETELNRLQSELNTMQEELQKANPQDPGAQAKYAEFQAKRKGFDEKLQPYNKFKSDKAEEYSTLVSGQFVKGYEEVCVQAGVTAKELGFTHVLSQKSGKIAASDPRRLVEEFLSRPMAVQPVGSDITEAVRTAMKLPEKTAAETKAAETVGDAPKAEEKK